MPTQTCTPTTTGNMSVSKTPPRRDVDLNVLAVYKLTYCANHMVMINSSTGNDMRHRLAFRVGFPTERSEFAPDPSCIAELKPAESISGKL